MCLLIYAKPGATPSKKNLRTAGANNPDGFGFALAIKDQLFHHRSMDLDSTIDLFHEMRAEYPKAHAIFHLRITTHGATSIDNCHPFVVDDGIVLAHNGMLPIKEEGGKSDTRQFAEEWLPELGVANVLDDPENFAELEKFAAGSKLAIISVSKQLAKPVYLVNEGDGHWDHGVWYSNNSYKYQWYTQSYKYTSHVTNPTGVTPADDFDYNPDVWVDEEDGTVFEWDDCRGWIETGNEYADIDRYFYCPTCDVNLGSDVNRIREQEFCYECGYCLFCEKQVGNCFCSGSKYSKFISTK